MKQFIWSRLWSFYGFWHYILYLLFSTFVISVDQGKMLLVLAQLELSGVRLWIFLHFDVWIRLSISLLQVHVNLLLGTSRQLQNVWLMNLLMLQRDHQTGNWELDYQSLLIHLMISWGIYHYLQCCRISLVLLLPWCSSPYFRIFMFLITDGFDHSCFSYAIKKKDEIERVAKANRWGSVGEISMTQEESFHVTLELSLLIFLVSLV